MVATGSAGGSGRCHREIGVRFAGGVALHRTNIGFAARTADTTQEIALQIRQRERANTVSRRSRVVLVADDRIQVGVRQHRDDLAFALQVIGRDGVQRPRDDLTHTPLGGGARRRHR